MLCSKTSISSAGAVCFIGFLLLFASCKKNTEVGIQTTAATDIGLNSANVMGNLSLSNGNTFGKCGVCWSKHAAPDVNDQTALADFTTGPFNVQLEGLDSASTYYARAFVQTSKKTSYGDELVFTTLRPLDSTKVWAPMNVGIGVLNKPTLASFGNEIFAFLSYQGIYRSADDGQTWKLTSNYIGTGEFGNFFNCNGDLFFLGSVQESKDLFKLNKSSGTWETVYTSTSFVPEIVQIGSYLFAGDLYRKIYKSQDGGNNWSQLLSSGQPTTANYCTSLTSINNRLFIGSEKGLFSGECINNQVNYDKQDFPNTVVNSLWVHGNELYVVAGNNLFLSTDFGTSWTMQNTLTVGSLILRFSGNNIYLLNGGSIYFSQDQCKHLVDLGGLPNVATTLCINDKYIFTASFQKTKNSYQILRLALK